jgi:amino acid permease
VSTANTFEFIVLPFELTAAGITIKFWRDDLNIGIWIAMFLVLLILIQFWGIRGYGEGKPTRKSAEGMAH